jgi:hypothetical protein
MDWSFGPSAAPTFGAATGSTKVGNRERKSWETRRRAYRWRRGRGAAGFEVNVGGFFFLRPTRAPAGRRRCAGEQGAGRRRSRGTTRAGARGSAFIGAGREPSVARTPRPRAWRRRCGGSASRPDGPGRAGLAAGPACGLGRATGSAQSRR